MTRPDIDAIKSRHICYNNAFCESIQCKDLQDLFAYIRELEEQRQEEILRYGKLLDAMSQYLGALQNELKRAGKV